MTATETTTAEEQVLTPDEALAAYEAARRELDAWNAEWAPVFQHREELEQAVAAAQQALTQALLRVGWKMHENTSFEVTLVEPDRGEYDPRLLPQTPEVLAACEIKIKREVVEKLVKRGVIDARTAANAYISKPATPYVRVKVKTDRGAA